MSNPPGRFAAHTSFGFFILLVIRHFRGEKALVTLHVARKGVSAITPGHDFAELVKHLPNWSIVLVSKLAPQLHCGECVLEG